LRVLVPDEIRWAFFAVSRGNGLWLKSRNPMRLGFEPDSRRRNEAVLTEIRASFDNEEAGSKTQAAAARL
jgi:hypothetical protein